MKFQPLFNFLGFYGMELAKIFYSIAISTAFSHASNRWVDGRSRLFGPAKNVEKTLNMNAAVKP